MFEKLLLSGVLKLKLLTQMIFQLSVRRLAATLTLVIVAISFFVRCHELPVGEKMGEEEEEGYEPVADAAIGNR